MHLYLVYIYIACHSGHIRGALAMPLQTSCCGTRPAMTSPRTNARTRTPNSSTMVEWPTWGTNVTTWRARRNGRNVGQHMIYYGRVRCTFHAGHICCFTVTCMVACPAGGHVGRAGLPGRIKAPEAAITCLGAATVRSRPGSIGRSSR